jgi:hypothetical protein
MISHRNFIFLIILLITAGSQLLAQSAFELKFISRVSQNNLQQNVRELVKCGNRLGGTRSGDKAAQLLYKKFKSYGFKPEIVIDPEKLVYTNNSWRLQVVEPRGLRGLIQHEWLAGFSPSIGLDTAHLTFVRSVRNIDEDSIAGGAVLIEQHPSEKMYRKLAEAGAKCILSYSVVNSTAYTNSAMVSIMKESDKNPVPMFNISNVAGKRLRDDLAKGDSIAIRYSSKTEIKTGHPQTVIGEFKGQSDDYYIVCAHGDSDSGGPGADDNASGESGVLEIARILNSMVKNRSLPLPRCSIKFIIWGNENYSATSYVKLHAKELKKIKGVINVDEIGIGRPFNCIYFEGNDIPHNHDMLKVLEKIGEEFAGKKGFWKESTTNPSQGGTDSYVFMPENLDDLDLDEEEIPSVTVFTAAWNEPRIVKQTRGWASKAWKQSPDSVTIGYSPFYHSSLDIPAFTTDKEPNKMVWGVNAVGIALLRLLWE